MKTNKVLVIFLLFILVATPVFANPIKKLFEQGVDHYTKKQYPQAIKKFEKILEIYPEFAPAYNYLGMVHQDKGGTSSDELLFLFKSAVKIDPNYAQAHENLSKTYYGLSEFDLAIEHGEKAVKLKPNLLSARLSLAWIYILGVQNPESAVGHFKYVLSKHDVPYARFGLGLAYFLNHQRPETMDVITQLKSGKHDKFAESLESMLRTGYFDPSQNSFVAPLMAPPKREKASNSCGYSGYVRV